MRTHVAEATTRPWRLYALVLALVLLKALENAAAAHGVHEKEIGKRDAGWAEWYAEHMARALRDAGYDLTGPAA